MSDWEHPDDRKARIDGEAYGAKYGPEFVDAHRALVTSLIGAYADSDATRLLEMLREMFWSGLWLPKDGVKF